ncbi:hypothetical protein [Nonomuraea lactucae]|uniref:hypothetical protein n=1 Tax=Nonomuraea lactucae TaxID=2249762 RepID=UPI000DE539B9|nr:hypothetical protein [Nonomuraea lactucae]
MRILNALVALQVVPSSLAIAAAPAQAGKQVIRIQGTFGAKKCVVANLSTTPTQGDCGSLLAAWEWDWTRNTLRNVYTNMCLDTDSVKLYLSKPVNWTQCNTSDKGQLRHFMGDEWQDFPEAPPVKLFSFYRRRQPYGIGLLYPWAHYANPRFLNLQENRLCVECDPQ